MNASPKYRLSENKYLYNGKELQDESLGGVSLGLYDYGWRFYDPLIGRFMTQDPMCETMSSWSPYSFTFDNPIKFNDPTGMVPDEFYFTENGKDLIKYVETDEPDRVFVAKSEIKSEDLGDITNKSLYNEVEMSDRQIEIRMNSNGYKKVTSEVEVENNQVETRYSMGVQDHSSTVSIVNGIEVTTGIDTKYVNKKFVEVGRYDTKHSEYETSYNLISNQIATREVYTEKLSYGKKNWIKSAINKFVDFGISMSGSHDQRQKKKINYIE